MMIDPGIFLAALGIIVLEMSEASAVSIALAADQKNIYPYLYTTAGVITVLIPTALAGDFFQIFPIIYVRLFSAILILYFAQRLARSARRSMKFQYAKNFPKSHKEEVGEKGVNVTAYSVGIVEAFEAAIVLIALFPENYSSTLIGLIVGVLIVLAFSYVLRQSIRKLKQGIVKVSVSAILFTFSAYWFIETITTINDIFLIPMFVLFFILVYIFATYGIKKSTTSPA
ncbi:hypothetical protein [Caldiplasma sukawensis]